MIEQGHSLSRVCWKDDRVLRELIRWSTANRKKILMHRHAVPSAVRGEVGLDIGFHGLSGGCIGDLHQVEHEFSNGIGLVQVRRVDMRRLQRDRDIILVPVLGAKGIGGLAQFKSVTEEVVHHVHTPALPVLQHHDRHAGRRHP